MNDSGDDGAVMAAGLPRAVARQVVVEMEIGSLCFDCRSAGASDGASAPGVQNPA